ncbi:MAG: hypothetical protein ABF289_00685 [Clostridiales bacterium]
MEDIIKNLVAEYLSIIDFLIKENSIYKFEDGNIGIEINCLNKILDKYSFITVRQKLKLWKTLNMIITDNDLYTTKKWIIQDNEKVRIRVYLVNLKTFYTLKNVFNSHNILCNKTKIN